MAKQKTNKQRLWELEVLMTQVKLDIALNSKHLESSGFLETEWPPIISNDIETLQEYQKEYIELINK